MAVKKKQTKKVAKKAVKKVATKKVAKKAVKKVATKKVAAKKSTAKKGQKAIRYTKATKTKIVAFVKKTNAKSGRGGLAAAVKQFKVSALTINRWIKAGN